MAGKTRSRKLPKPKADFVDRAIAYAERAADERNADLFCKWIRQAANRFLADLKNSETRKRKFVFSRAWANKACAFIELLPHVEGVWETPTIKLHDAHVFFVVQLFGFRNFRGGRRFTSALLAVARKNAKSTLAAAISLVVYCLENEEGPKIVAAATTGQQARIVWDIAKKMVDKTPALQEAFALQTWANAISNYSVGGVFKPINSKASTQDGLNPSMAVLDEIHAHKTHELLNVLKSASGARDNPLFLYTTTEGYETPGPWPELRHFAKQLLDGVIEADHFLALYYAVDDDDDDFSPTAWHKANPLWDVNPILAREIAKEIIEAKSMPGKLAEFRIKRLNRQSASAKSLIDIHKWNLCGGAVDLDWLQQYPCWAAFDLSSTTDLTAWRLVWRVDGKWYTWGRRWTTESSVWHRTESGSGSYAGWVAGGFMEQIPGNVIDYATVEARIREDVDRFNPTLIAFDDWNAKDLANRLIEDGLPLVRFIQGPKSYHPAMQEIERAYLSGNLAHGNDPVLKWCAANVVPRYDANLNMAPDKSRSPERIDDMSALYMAIGVALTADPDGNMAGFIQSPVIN